MVNACHQIPVILLFIRVILLILKGPRAEVCTILYKVDVPKSKTTIIWTPILEGHVVRCGSKNRHPIHMCLKEIGPCAQNMLIILGSIVNMIGRDL